MPKQLKDILQGVKSSKKGPLSIGKDPGVDYKPKAGDEDKFVAKHEIEDHEDRVGNEPNAGTKTKEAKFPKQSKNVYEAKKAEDMQCNHSAKGVACPVHGMAECYDMKTIKEDELDEVSSDSLMRYRHAAAPERRDPEKGEKRKVGMNLALKKILGGDELGNKPKVKAAGMSKKEMGEDVELDEVLTKSTSAGETIHDFVHSDNPKFAGKSKEKRKQMALAAYYKKQNEETIQEAVPRGDTDGAEEMVKSELKALANKAMHLAMAMPQGMHVEPWVQAKIAQAKSYVSDVHDYMIFGDHPDEEDEQAPADTPMTFPSSTVDTGRI